MSTVRNFQDMLNEYLPNELLAEEFIKRDYFLQNIEKDNSWGQGDLIVPFRGSRASTVKLGSLAAASEINQSKYVRGKITDKPEMWASLIFNHRDIMEHGKLSEQNFLKILPGEVEDLMDFMKMAFSLQITNGEAFAKATANGTLNAGIVVDRPERFEVGQPVMLEDGNTAAAKYWVKSIDINTATIVLSALMDLSTIADLTAYTLAQVPVFYFDGGETAGNRFTSIKKSLLSAVNGGTSSLYGQSKLAYPYLQAINVSGATVTASNILDKLFDAMTLVRNRGKGNPDKFVMSYKHLGSIMKIIELSKGAYKMADSSNATIYGWTEIEVVGVKGRMTVVAIQEMDDDSIFILDLRALKIYSNGFFQKRRSPEGREYFEIRNTSGYQYVVDACFFGDVVLERPSRCGILHSIPNY
jgi:hypothetical protein